MSNADVLKSLGYDRSPNYIDKAMAATPSSSLFGHLYRKAVEECGLQGVYLIKEDHRHVDVPVVFYCTAHNEVEATRIHKLVWNQDVAPFVLVETPAALRLYCGFRFAVHGENNRARGILSASIAFNEVADRLSAFRADSIDSGRVWDEWGDEVTPKTRVDWSLLDNLEKLGDELRRQGSGRDVSHALIGKYVYLRYLRDRNILSDRKLDKWGIDPKAVFSRNAEPNAFQELNRRLDSWLNGAIFPLEPDTFGISHLQLVAGVFSGDSPEGQLHLDFQPYDFSFIPIETLSVIYEQFLHSPAQGESSRGRKAGAYYTPLPLVNYMLNELENRKPLAEGMRVLDPSCGSGAFLVQCYRALIEKRLARGGLSPGDLRELLIQTIYGVERDSDACQVAELSLMLTLLDYVSPPDLENDPEFKLPMLRDRNIFQADFFDPDSEWAHKSRNLSFDWLVGNPPWREFKKSDEDDRYILEWAARNSEDCPIGGNQAAEAFVWQSIQFINKEGVAGLVLPAMTLFKMESRAFRQKLFTEVQVWSVANFSNLRFFLFAGRSKRPAMSLFFSVGDNAGSFDNEVAHINMFAPFVINQRANRTIPKNGKKSTWNIVVNGSELGEISPAEAVAGEIETWKMAMWGSFRDGKLLRRIAKRFPSLIGFLELHGLIGPNEGFQLRDPDSSKEAVEEMLELAGKLKLDFRKLKECGRIFEFPKKAISIIPRSLAYLRKKGGKAGLKVSSPPHIIVDAARRFAIYSNRFIAVPPRQIGISGSESREDILKALSVFLSSDFVTYQQFFTSPEWGISSARATLSTLTLLPIPLTTLSENELREWSELRDALAEQGSGGKAVSTRLLEEVNQRVYQLLGLNETERILVEDFVHWNMRMIDGMTPHILKEPLDHQTIHDYLMALKKELDIFLGDHAGIHHRIEALHDEWSSIIAISLTTANDTEPSIFHADDKAAAHLRRTREHLMKRHSQWLYFERSLRVFTNNTLYMFKPLERIHWTKRQAILDAGDVIADTLGQQDDS